MTSHFSMKTLTIILALALTGCSALEHKLMIANDPLIIPPNVIQPTVCEKPSQLLFCEDEDLLNCEGFIDDKPIDIN
mgnify:FL=1